MTQAYVDGNEGWASSSPFTLTLPSDLAAGEVVYVYASVFNNNTSINLTGMANPGSLVRTYFGYNGVNDSFMAWAFLAGSADAGATLTYTEVGASTYIGSVIQVYSGASVPPANPNGANVGYAYATGGFVNTNTSTATAPAIPGGTPVAGCWLASFISAGVGNGDGGATLTGATLRQQSTASGVNGFDSNASLGAAGSTAGGGTYTTVANGPVVMITTVIPPATTSISGSAAFVGSGTLTAAGHLAASAAFVGSGSLVATGHKTVPGAASLFGSGSMSAAASVAVPGAAALIGAGALTAAGQKAVPGSAAMAGTGTLTASEAEAVPGASALAGGGSLTATGGIFGIHAGAAALAGTGALAAGAVRTAQGGAAWPGSGALTARPVVIVPVVAGSATGSIGAGPRSAGSIGGAPHSAGSIG